LFNVEFHKEFGRSTLQCSFHGQFLDYQRIANESNFGLIVYPEINMLKRLNDKLNATFWVYVPLRAYVQSYVEPKIEVPWIKFPIDEWKNQVKSVLSSFDTDWNQ
jgi:hypothetical protein